MIEGIIKLAIAPYRAQLIRAIQTAQVGRGKELLQIICKQQPLFSLVIPLLINATAEDAVEQLAQYDSELAGYLSRNLVYMRQLQQALTPPPAEELPQKYIV